MQCCWICPSAEQLLGYVLYKLVYTEQPLPLCPKEIWLLWIGTPLKKEAPEEFMHAPTARRDVLCVASVGGPGAPPLLDVWSELVFTVLLTECWRMWADMSPQYSLLDWLCSHIPSVKRHLWRGWATVSDALVCAFFSLSSKQFSKKATMRKDKKKWKIGVLLWKKTLVYTIKPFFCP